MSKNFKSKAMKAHKTQALFLNFSITKGQVSLNPNTSTSDHQGQLILSLRILSQGGQYKLFGAQLQAWNSPADA
jgi:hypothetical protein